MTKLPLQDGRSVIVEIEVCSSSAKSFQQFLGRAVIPYHLWLTMFPMTSSPLQVTLESNTPIIPHPSAFDKRVKVNKTFPYKIKFPYHTKVIREFVMIWIGIAVSRECALRVKQLRKCFWKMKLHVLRQQNSSLGASQT